MEGVDFEKAIAELEALVERLQKPDLSLRDAIALYRRGTELAQSCEAALSEADLQVQQLTRAVHERFEGYASDVERETT